MARVFFILAALIFSSAIAHGKEWRGIVPLKSSRSEVERRFGQPDEWGYYSFKDERVSIEYSEGPCRGLYSSLGRGNCKCMVRSRISYVLSKRDLQCRAIHHRK